MKNSYFFRILFLITSWSCCVTITAQSRVYKHYTVEDGLPSSEVYTAFQDSKGYMWFATDAGVSRFNGYEFENFDESDGLTDNTVFLFTEDHLGRIWFGTFNCQLSYYENGFIYSFEHNDKIKEEIKTSTAMTSFYIDSNSTIWIGFHNEGVYLITNDGNISFFGNKKENSYLYVNLIDELGFVAGYVRGEKQDSIAQNFTQFTYKIYVRIQEYGEIIYRDRGI